MYIEDTLSKTIQVLEVKTKPTKQNQSSERLNLKYKYDFSTAEFNCYFSLKQQII